jgi:hypothetical protein
MARERHGDQGYERLYSIPDGHTVFFRGGSEAYELALHVSDLRARIGSTIRQVIVDLLEDRELNSAEGLMSAYLRWVERHPYDKQSVDQYVWTAFEHIRYLGEAGKTDDSISWYRYVSKIAEARPQDVVIWDARQKGIVNLITVLAGSGQIDSALSFLDELFVLWSNRSEDGSIGERVRESIRYLCIVLAKNHRFAEAEILVGRVNELLKQRHDFSMVIGLGEALVNISSIGADSREFGLVSRSMDALRGLHEEEKVENQRLRSLQAISIYNLMLAKSRIGSLDDLDVLYSELKQLDEKREASQSLADFRALSIRYWLCTAYKVGSINSAERAFEEARTLADHATEQASVTVVIGAHLLAAMLMGDGERQRASAVVSEYGTKMTKEIWTSLEQSLGREKVMEVQRLLRRTE